MNKYYNTDFNINNINNILMTFKQYYFNNKRKLN